jgi:hypothetical protein
MSRGFGCLERFFLEIIIASAKPMTFADIIESELPGSGYNGSFKAWRDDHGGRVRSMRRALRTLIDKGYVVELGRGGRRQPFRYCLDPEIKVKEPSDETQAMLASQANYQMTRAVSLLA